jgi:hypothetical protein
MKTTRLLSVFLISLLTLIGSCSSKSVDSDKQDSEKQENAQNMQYTAWQNGPPKEADYFPISVWLQSPSNAERYKAAGINLYIGLWQGPTEAQLSELRAAGMPVVCSQNAVGLRHIDDDLIVAWMHGDEPDNAQSLPEGEGYGPPILPEVIVDGYQKIKANDPSRPVFLNLGQGVAWDEYVGRGVRTNHPEDYPEYIKGTDIVSFDIYPAASTRPQTSGKLWLVAHGVERLVKWSRPDQPVWNCIECSRIRDVDHKATPHQVKAEVWMSLVHGSMGILYFVHEWAPKFNEHALLDDPEMLAAVTAINHQIHTLAPVLNSPTITEGIEVTSSDPEVPVATMLKQYDNATYLFAVAMRDGQTQATFTLPDLPSTATAEVLEEGRNLTVANGKFTDDFQPYEVHLYRID